METTGKRGIGVRSRQLPPRAGASPTEGAPKTGWIYISSRFALK